MVAAFQANAFQNTAFQSAGAAAVAFSMAAREINADHPIMAFYVLQSVLGLAPATISVSLSEDTSAGATGVIELP